PLVARAAECRARQDEHGEATEHDQRCEVVNCRSNEPTIRPTNSPASQRGIIPGTRYACAHAMIPMNAANTMLCQNVLRSTSPSRPTSPTVDTPIAMFCGEII